MTIVVELDPETEARLTAEAEARGLAVDVYALAVLRNASSTSETGTGRPTVESLEAMFNTLAKGSEQRPLLLPEAFERENMYEDRW